MRCTAEEIAELLRRNRLSWRDVVEPTIKRHLPQFLANAKASEELQREINSKTRTTPAPGARGRAQSVMLTLPWPPSVNHYWRRNKGLGMHISSEGKQFQEDVVHACQGADGVMGRVYVSITANPPDRRKRDLDNLLKALLDALNHAGMIEDDGLIDELRIERGYSVKGGRVSVTITTR